MATVFPTRPPEKPYTGTLEPRISTVLLLLYRRGTPSTNPQSIVKTLLRPNLHPPSTKTTAKTFKPANLIRKHLKLKLHHRYPKLWHLELETPTPTPVKPPSTLKLPLHRPKYFQIPADPYSENMNPNLITLLF
ncbi:hypothetical protein COLO4_04049 [Corchorus olitorius]|uniref:Uncharacterized protein n=1 Tax=Corchorus olitorius TaxID=93759 RepID=A0A1R3KVG0_9ROSI|nr:hypothetical protein COLO4_04049 [Corchorus olitorius]